MSTLQRVINRYGKQRNLALSLICYLVADAFISEDRVLTYSVLILLVIAGPLAADRSNRQRLGTVTLAVLMVAFGYWSVQRVEPRTLFLANIVAALFFFHLIILISRHLLLKQGQVTGETLWAAINVYMLLGLMFAFLYGAVFSLAPGAFSGGVLENADGEVTKSMVYFSFVTMTTLGYGDITPSIQPAATLAYVQALIGQLYVAILIARLVSMYSIHPPKE